MLFLKYAMLTGGIGLFITAVLVVLFEAQRVWHLSRSTAPGEWPVAQPLPWKRAAQLAALAGLAMLPALAIAVIPSGMAGVRPKAAAPTRNVISKEGLPVGLGVTVRYQLGPTSLPTSTPSAERP